MGTKNRCVNKECDKWNEDSESGCMKYYTISQCKFSIGLYGGLKPATLGGVKDFPGEPSIVQDNTELVCNFCGETLTIARHPIFKGRYNTYICSDCIVEAMKLLCKHVNKNQRGTDASHREWGNIPK